MEKQFDAVMFLLEILERRTGYLGEIDWVKIFKILTSKAGRIKSVPGKIIKRNSKKEIETTIDKVKKPEPHSGEIKRKEKSGDLLDAISQASETARKRTGKRKRGEQ